jgi:hypothetical protein
MHYGVGTLTFNDIIKPRAHATNGFYFLDELLRKLHFALPKMCTVYSIIEYSLCFMQSALTGIFLVESQHTDSSSMCMYRYSAKPSE